MSTADELVKLAEYFDRLAAQYTETDVEQSRYITGVVSAYTYCAIEARERAAALAEGPA